VSTWGRVRRGVETAIKRARKLAEVDPIAAGLARSLADRIDREPDSTKLASLAGRLEQQRRAILAPALAVEQARAEARARQVEQGEEEPRGVVDELSRARGERRAAAGLPEG
jgi:hypothetical protein